MSRKCVEGKCRICGETKKLTFEHVPPENTFNNSAVHIISTEQVINQVCNPDILPWDYSRMRGKIQQRGRGDYYLCGDCNSKTGQWYVPEYSKFVYNIHYALIKVAHQEFGALGLKDFSIKPLPIFKQIITMFCDINEGWMGDDTLKNYLLNRYETSFDNKRYNLYLHIHSGSVERMNGIMAQLIPGIGTVLLSEITMYPIGLTLYIDKPEGFIPEGVEITTFSNFNYDEECSMDIIIPRLESNIMFSGDYRTKGEIQET